MKKAIFNNSIELEYLEGFKELTAEENAKYFTGNLLRLSFQNTDKHILISLSKSKDSIFNRFASIKSIINGSISNLSRNLKDFSHLEEYNSLIIDVPSIAECFSYTANDKDVKQYGELSIFKIGKAIYSIYCVCRLDDKEENIQLFKQFKDSLKQISSI